MPKGKDPLPAADIDKIRRWIAEGAADDTPGPSQRRHRRRAPARLQAAAGHHLHRLLARRQAPGRLRATTKFCCTRATAPALVARLVGLSRAHPVAALLARRQVAGRRRRLARAASAKSRSGTSRSSKLKQSVPVTFDTLYGVSWSPDGTQDRLRLRRQHHPRHRRRHRQAGPLPGAHSDWCWAPSSRRTTRTSSSISRDMSMKLTEVATQRFVDNITSITPGALKGGLLAVARRPQAKRTDHQGTSDGGPTRCTTRCMIGGADGIPRLYKMHRTVQRTIGDDNNRVRVYPALSGRIFAVRFSKDGTASPPAAASTARARSASSRPTRQAGQQAGRDRPGLHPGLPPRRQGGRRRRVRRQGPPDRRRLGQGRQGIRPRPAGRRDRSEPTHESKPGGYVTTRRSLRAAAPPHTETSLIDSTAHSPETRSMRYCVASSPLLALLSPATPRPRRRRCRPARSSPRSRPAPRRSSLATPFAYSQLVLTGTLAGGERIDVTRMVALEPPAKVVSITPTGLVRPLADGTGTHQGQPRGADADIPVEVKGQKDKHDINFVRDVMPIVSPLRLQRRDVPRGRGRQERVQALAARL